MKKITETKTEDLVVITERQAKLIYNLLLSLGQWKVLEVLHQPRKGEAEQFLETLWDEFEEIFGSDYKWKEL